MSDSAVPSKRTNLIEIWRSFIELQFPTTLFHKIYRNLICENEEIQRSWSLLHGSISTVEVSLLHTN